MDVWFVVALVCGSLGCAVLFWAFVYVGLKVLAAKNKYKLDDDLVKYTKWPALPILVCIALAIIQPYISDQVDNPTAMDQAQQAFVVIFVLSIGWLIITLLTVIERAVWRKRKSQGVKDRRIRTSTIVIKRLMVIIVAIVTVSVAIMTVQAARDIGYSMLASAGVLTVVLGLAITPSMENLLGNVQIALTQPLRLGDEVVINGEWGTVEEICSTYIVIAIWDERRMIVPLSAITKDIFYNWTRNNPQLIGIIYLYLDYKSPIGEMRKKLKKILAKSPKWDKRVQTVQISDASTSTITVRLLASAKCASDAWDLRCEVREKMILFLAKHYPWCLPRNRVTMMEPQSDDPNKISGRYSKRSLRHKHVHPSWFPRDATTAATGLNGPVNDPLEPLIEEPGTSQLPETAPPPAKGWGKAENTI